MNVRFTSADIIFRVKQKKTLAAFIEQIFLKEGKVLSSLDYILCSDNYLLQINKDFLAHDFYTDIITFDLSDKNIDGIRGEVYISTDRVKENAQNHSVNVQKEFLRVAFHGVLHLCGYKDKKKSEITLMRQKEDYYLHLFEENLGNAQ